MVDEWLHLGLLSAEKAPGLRFDEPDGVLRDRHQGEEQRHQVLGIVHHDGELHGELQGPASCLVARIRVGPSKPLALVRERSVNVGAVGAFTCSQCCPVGSHHSTAYVRQEPTQKYHSTNGEVRSFNSVHVGDSLGRFGMPGLPKGFGLTAAHVATVIRLQA